MPASTSGQVIYPPSADIDLAAISMRDEFEMESGLCADYTLTICIDDFIRAGFPRSDNTLLREGGSFDGACNVRS
jgi:hypothetical protein